MSHIEVFYEGDLSTRSVHQESGCDAKTQMTKLSPTDLFASSLGACILTVMALSGEKMGVDFSGAKVSLVKEMSRDLPRRVTFLGVQFSSPASLPEEMRAKLEKVARDCPIHYSLHPDIKVEFHFQWGMS